MAKEEKNVLRPEGVKQAGLAPTTDAATNDELLNAQSGTLPSVGAVPVGREDATRASDNPVNYHRGLFALMASFDWDKGKFSERMEDVALRNEGLSLLGLPTNLPVELNPDANQMASLIESLTSGSTRGPEQEENTGRSSGDYVKGLVQLSQAVSKNRSLPPDAEWESPSKKKKR